MQGACPLLVVFCSVLAVFCGSDKARAAAGDPGGRDAVRRAAVLTDIGRLRLELKDADSRRQAVLILKEASELDPANILARYWLGIAYYRSSGLGVGQLSKESVGLAGLEFEAVFKLSSLDRSRAAQDLRRRSIAAMDDFAKELSGKEKRFNSWWKRRKSQLLSEQPQVDMTHIIRRGDSYRTIALRYYGDAAEAARLIKANPGLNPKKLRPGRRIKVPGVLLDLPKPDPELDRTARGLVAVLRKSGSGAQRRAAAERLGLRDCAAAISFLAEALRGDPDQWVRAECALALGRLGADQAEPVVAAALIRDASPACRREAARALRRLGGRGSVAVLLRALGDISPQVVAAAAGSLVSREPAKVIAPLLRALASPSALVRRAATMSLRDMAADGRLSPRHKKTLESLMARGGGAVRSGAILVLLALDVRGIEKRLPALLADGDPLVLKACCQVAAMIAESGDGLATDVTDLLEAALEDQHPGVIIAAAVALARSRKGKSPGKKALLTLAELLEDKRLVNFENYQALPAGKVALSLLKKLTGARLAGDTQTWRRWLENR